MKKLSASIAKADQFRNVLIITSISLIIISVLVAEVLKQVGYDAIGSLFFRILLSAGVITLVLTFYIKNKQERQSFNELIVKNIDKDPPVIIGKWRYRTATENVILEFEKKGIVNIFYTDTLNSKIKEKYISGTWRIIGSLLYVEVDNKPASFMNKWTNCVIVQAHQKGISLIDYPNKQRIFVRA